MKRVKIIASIFAVLLCVTLIYAWYIKGGIPPQSAEDYEYDNQYEVLEELEDAGFQNITLLPIDDEDMDDYPWLQMVKEVSIDGDTVFRAGKRYRSDVPVQISYYRVPRKKLPLNSDELQNYDQETIVQMFQDAGFTNVSILEYVDLEPGADIKNEVYLDDDNSFAEGQEYPRSIPIYVVAHYPVPEHSVAIHVNFEENNATVTEPVRLFLDDVETWILEVEQDTSYELTMGEGDHTIMFQGADETQTSRKITFTVDADMMIHFDLMIADTILLEGFSVDYKKER